MVQNGNEVLIATLEDWTLGSFIFMALEISRMALVHFRVYVILKGEEKNKTAITMLDNPCRSSRAYFCQLLVLACSLLKIQPH